MILYHELRLPKNGRSVLQEIESRKKERKKCEGKVQRSKSTRFSILRPLHGLRSLRNIKLLSFQDDGAAEEEEVVVKKKPIIRPDSA